MRLFSQKTIANAVRRDPVGFVAQPGLALGSVARGRLPVCRTVSTMPSASLAVLRDGTVALDPSGDAVILERPPASRSQVRTLVLNRTKSLNALNTEMLEILQARVAALDRAESVRGILLTSAPGRAFCAGGDIRELYEAGKDGDYAPLADYFRKEYSLDWSLGSLRSTLLVSFLNGIVMGGGAGLSMHGRFRIATENTVFAMPECAIALHPDVGMTRLLSRIPGGLGVYLALTGARLKGRDVVTAGIATHFVHAHQLPEVEARLSSVEEFTPASVEQVLSEFQVAEPLSPVPDADSINECFMLGGDLSSLQVSAIVASLKEMSAREGRPGQFAQESLEMMTKACPTSVKVTLEALKRANKMASLAECLQMDFRLVARATRRPDFYAGVRSAVITKDRNPKWEPATIAQVSDVEVEKFFRPIVDDIGVPELALDVPEPSPRL